MDGANQVSVGIDVAKATLDLHLLPSGQAHTLPNVKAGFQQLKQLLPNPARCLIVLEATGGFEREVVAELIDAGYRVAVINPRRASPYLHLAELLLGPLKESKKAVEVLGAARQQFPDTPEIVYYLAIAQREAKRAQEAENLEPFL